MRLLLAAATEWRTLIWLGLGLVAALALHNPFPFVIGLGVYLYSVQRLANSPAFKAAGERVLTAEGLAAQFQALAEEARTVISGLPRVVSPGQHRDWRARATDVVEAARSIYEEWQANVEQQAQKQQVVSEAMQLAHLYLRILRAYQIVYAQRRPVDLRAVQERVDRNQEKLGRSQDLEARRLLNQAIEMDSQVLEQAATDEAERERYQARLAAMESSMELFRRQMYDPESSPEGAGLRDMLLEAQAMDEALSEVQMRAQAHS